VIATGFLADCGGDRPVGRGHQETARFPSGSAGSPAAPQRHPSHAFCVEPLDLASVSPSLRSVSNSVRRTHPSVSPHLRRKRPSIARRTVPSLRAATHTDDQSCRNFKSRRRRFLVSAFIPPFPSKMLPLRLCLAPRGMRPTAQPCGPPRPWRVGCAVAQKKRATRRFSGCLQPDICGEEGRGCRRDQ
jgi:hypothetical protein